MMLEPLFDSYGRKIESLRISLTDRCNFRCEYCMPAEGLPWIPGPNVMTHDEVTRLARLFVRLGVKEIRLTGGEPTLRAGLPKLVASMSAIPGLEDLSLTTNGFLLKRLAGPLAEAGLRRLNVSLDSLVREKFAEITRRDAFEKVLEGLYEAAKYPSLHPIKINAIGMRGFTESEIIPFARFARETGFIVRFIEYMPLDADGNWQMEQVLTGNEILEIINRDFMPMEPVPNQDPSSTARRYRFVDGIGEMGFVNPVSQPFCSTCNRIRLTADGQLRTCLFSIEETDLLGPLRDGASDAYLETHIREAVSRKELKHRINEGAQFQRASRSMSQIGG